MINARKILLWLLVIAYYPIFIVGAFLIGTSILIRRVGLLLTVDINLAKREFQPIKRSFRKLLGYD